MGACHPAKDCPVIASMISDKDPNVRKSALSALRFVSFTLSLNVPV
jgi:cytoskeleton-associated protein 5